MPVSSPDQPYLNLLEDVTIQPIFILGDHRSGTTLLYQLLAATECFNVVTVYHILRPDEILANYVNGNEDKVREQIRTHFAQLGLTDRLIDAVKVSPDLPEEYGFVFRNRGFKAQLDSRTLPIFVQLCKKVQFTSGQNKSILLKNPWDILNFMNVKQAFPHAKFIFIHRHPLHTINAQLRVIRELFASKNPYVAAIAHWYGQIFDRPLVLFFARKCFSSTFGLGLRIVRRHVLRMANYFLEHIQQLQAESYISIRYEDLCSDANQTVDHILKFLGIHPNEKQNFQSFISPRPIKLLEEVRRNKDAIQNQLNPYLAHFGYSRC